MCLNMDRAPRLVQRRSLLFHQTHYTSLLIQSSLSFISVRALPLTLSVVDRGAVALIGDCFVVLLEQLRMPGNFCLTCLEWQHS